MVYGLFTSKFKPRKKTDKMAGEAPLPPSRGFKEKQLLVIELLVIGFFKCFND